MDGIWSAIIGVVGTGFVSLLGLVILGKLVPVSNVTRAETEAVTWKKAYDTMKQSYDAQQAILVRQQITAEITEQVMKTISTQINRRD